MNKDIRLMVNTEGQIFIGTVDPSNGELISSESREVPSSQFLPLLVEWYNIKTHLFSEDGKELPPADHIILRVNKEPKYRLYIKEITESNEADKGDAIEPIPWINTAKDFLCHAPGCPEHPFQSQLIFSTEDVISEDASLAVKFTIAATSHRNEGKESFPEEGDSIYLYHDKKWLRIIKKDPTCDWNHEISALSFSKDYMPVIRKDMPMLIIPSVSSVRINREIVCICGVEKLRQELKRIKI